MYKLYVCKCSIVSNRISFGVWGVRCTSLAQTAPLTWKSYRSFTMTWESRSGALLVQ